MDKIKSATEARVHFGEVMRDVSERDEIIIVERGGSPKIAIMSVAYLNELRSKAGNTVPEWKRLLEEAHEQVRKDGNVPLMPPPEDVIREMREERNAHFPDVY